MTRLALAKTLVQGTVTLQGISYSFSASASGTAVADKAFEAKKLAVVASNSAATVAARASIEKILSENSAVLSDLEITESISNNLTTTVELVEDIITLFISGYANFISKYILTKDRTLVYQGQFNCLDNPSWMAYDSNSGCLFATSEVDNYNNLNSGAVQSFKVDSELNLSSINSVSSIGASPANIFIDTTNKNILTSNYNNGIMAVIPYSPSGELQEESQTIVHTPTNVSHIHTTIIYKNIVTIVDLGLDTVTQYLTTDTGYINDPSFNTIQFPTGSGPRQIRVHSSGTFAVVVCELANTLTILPMKVVTGAIINKSFSDYFTISTLPPDLTDTTDMGAAQIQFSESGKYVYVSNRDKSSPDQGRSSISSFKINFGKNLTLKWIQTVSSNGAYPRYFTFLNNGRIMAIVNQVDGNFVSYLMDKKTGLIKPETGISTDKNVLTGPSFILPF